MTDSIRDAIHQTRPFDSPETEALLTLLRSVDLVAERAHAPLCREGLTSAQYNVLRILRGAGDEGLQTYQVVERLVTRAPNITRLVDKLERKELLTRSRNDADRRVVRLRITPAGEDLLGRLDEPVRSAAEEAMSGLDADGLRLLIDQLNRLREPLEESGGRGKESPS